MPAPVMLSTIALGKTNLNCPMLFPHISSQNSLSSHNGFTNKDRPRSLSEDRRGSQDVFETVALLSNGEPATLATIPTFGDTIVEHPQGDSVV